MSTKFPIFIYKEIPIMFCWAKSEQATLYKKQIIFNHHNLFINYST